MAMTESDFDVLTSFNGGKPLTPVHKSLYAWFQRHYHRVRAGSLDLSTLLVIHFLASQSKPGDEDLLAFSADQEPAEQPAPRPSKAETPLPDFGPPEEPEEPPPEAPASIDWSKVQKGAKVWVLTEDGVLDGEYAGKSKQRGKVSVKIQGQTMPVPIESVQLTP